MRSLEKDNFDVGRPVLFRIVRLYYIATPVFLLAEIFAGISFRVPYFLATPALRYTYYALCVACGAGCYFRPRATYIIAFLESTTNVILLFIGFFVATYAGMDSFVNSGGVQVPRVFTFKWMVGFGITGVIWIISFKYGVWALQRKWKPRNGTEAAIKSALFSNPEESTKE